MADLVQLQKTLNSDPAEKKKFLADPKQYLKDHGIAVSKETEKHLVDQLKKAGGAHTAWSVGITVGT